MNSFRDSVRHILLNFLDPNYNINNQLENIRIQNSYFNNQLENTRIQNSYFNTLEEESNFNSVSNKYIIRNDVSQLISQLPIIILEEQFIIEKEPFCSICLEKLKIDNTVIQLPCQHLFCFGKHEDECQGIIPWIKKNKTCPVCRKTIYFK